MIVSINPSTMPPAVALEEPDDFTSLKVVLRGAAHVFISPAELQRLAGNRAADPVWEGRFQEMIQYAAAHGWTDDDGAVRAHIEWPT